MASLPPGQQLAAAHKWPLVGERQPRPSDKPWTLTITGLVQTPQVWSLEALQQLGEVEQAIDIHCVTRWSKLGMRFVGVPLRRLLTLALPRPEAKYVSFIARSARDHSTSLSWADVQQLEPLVAWQADGEPLAVEHGGPLRLVVPQRYFYKSVKWLERVELLATDRLGYWEAEAGYHNHADPWHEERYLAPHLTKQQTAQLLAQRDFRGLDLRGIVAAGHDLTGLKAEQALLRDGNFQDANLTQANFHGANLSNAHLERAILREAQFTAADCEGANFSAADLRGADFTGASLFGASFCDELGNAGAILDPSTRLPLAARDQLMPIQAEYVRRHLQ